MNDTGPVLLQSAALLCSLYACRGELSTIRAAVKLAFTPPHDEAFPVLLTKVAGSPVTEDGDKVVIARKRKH